MSLEYYNEVVANLTWYQLNSDFKDPMYQYMNKLSTELYVKFKAPLLTTNYKAVDDFIINNRNVTLYYGSYECSTPEKAAFMDSWFSCFLFQLPFFLEKIQLGHIGYVFVLPIMLISIFGGIKESYKWFILHQAIWDAFLCYDSICAKPTLFGWSVNSFTKQTTCFYRDQTDLGTFAYLIRQGFRVCLRNASFTPIFHLAFSRFICMYFPRFYKKFTKNGYKILIFLILFNLICVTIFSLAFITTIYFLSPEFDKCDDLCPSKNSTYCQQNIPKYFQCFNRLIIDFTNTLAAQTQFAKTFKYISYSIPPIMFLLSNICAGFLFYKIASQLKFQLKTNPESFKQTIKIIAVVGFQCLTMSLIFVITGIQKFMQIKGQIFDTFRIYDELPTWLLLLQYYTTTASLNMIRLIVDSFVILVVLSGYSKAVVLTFKFLCLCFTNPKTAFKKFKNKLNGKTEVTIISTSRK